MPQIYFKRDDNTFSDFGYYQETPPAREGGHWIEGYPDVPAAQNLSPLEKVTAAVKELPVEKRANPEFGIFLNQCLLAIQNSDQESLQYIVNNFNTQDADYLALLAKARVLFGLS
jgi:hypothetical protein